MARLNNFQMDEIILNALKEDISSEDITTRAIYTDERHAEIQLIAKEDGIIAGLDVFKRTFKLLNYETEFSEYKKDGDRVESGDTIMHIYSDVATILSAERTALNFLQRMSGIATTTNEYVKALGDDSIKVMDTRKTTPGLRLFEKYAVKAGGGCNHRYNLSDGFLIKDNHIDAAGGTKEAIEMAKAYMPYMKKIEVETESLSMVEEAVNAGANIIMLDNMDLETVKKAVEIIGDKAIIECSGNITLNNINRYRGTNIDYVSVGALTHSVKALDISLKNLRYI